MTSEPYATITYVTISNEAAAEKLARSLIEKRLAACVNIVQQVKSIYEWQGKVENEIESMLIIKSNSSKSSDLNGFIEMNHSYDCPEIISVKIDSGNKRYLDWIHKTLTKDAMKSD